MGKYTEYELKHGANGHTPDQVADMNLSDVEWEKKGAEIRVMKAQVEHRLATARQSIVHDFELARFDPDLRKAAADLQASEPDGPSVDDIIDARLDPAREKALSDFDAWQPGHAPAVVHQQDDSALNLMFSRLLKGEKS